jgi:hypothetical protein
VGGVSVIAITVKHLLKAGLNDRDLVHAVELIEAEGRESALRLFIEMIDAYEIPPQVHGPALLELGRAVVGLEKPANQASGSAARWGYHGPVTPRLPEREWWPLRRAVLERDNHTCHYCGEKPEQMCADHVIPLSRGGSNEMDNLVACCLPCNSSKSDRLLSEWEGRWR